MGRVLIVLAALAVIAAGSSGVYESNCLAYTPVVQGTVSVSPPGAVQGEEYDISVLCGPSAQGGHYQLIFLDDKTTVLDIDKVPGNSSRIINNTVIALYDGKLRVAWSSDNASGTCVESQNFKDDQGNYLSWRKADKTEMPKTSSLFLGMLSGGAFAIAMCGRFV